MSATRVDLSDVLCEVGTDKACAAGAGSTRSPYAKAGPVEALEKRSKPGRSPVLLAETLASAASECGSQEAAQLKVLKFDVVDRDG